MAGDRKGRPDGLAHERTAPAPSPDLDRTATQVPQSKKSAPAEPSRLTRLGRYTIERELGAGGMGIVYAAFDPDLERRVALKVLLAPDGHDAHKQRLLREARAMARLTHPNVVTVHEVQTADGRDYVAMELVEGESLAEWLRSAQRSEADILAAFVAAGRGLAAAHAAGMVHRDFKPHNVLRSTTGRIAVTDFGLAREAHADPFAVTGVSSPPIAGTPVESGTPSTPLAGLTMTGSVLGTPAYMAPEQWVGGKVTAGTDQFAFCVALWEALAGERPFHGDTLEILKKAVELGPSPLDDSKLPPRLRPIIRRGLDPVPSKRWPSMDALIAELAPPVPANKKPWLPVGFAVVGLAGFGAYLATRGGDEAPAIALADCPSPTEPPTPALPLEGKTIAREVAVWKAAHDKACALTPPTRETQLTCLDRVLSRLDAVAKAGAKLDGNGNPVDLAAFTIDPAVCSTNPRLTATSPALADALATAIREEANPGIRDRDAIISLLARIGDDPCAGAWAHLQAAKLTDPDRAKHMADAEMDAERCGDDRIRADTAIRAAAFAAGRSVFGVPNTSKLKLAIAAVERISQPDLAADVDRLQMEYAAKAENLSEAIKFGERARTGYAARARIAKVVATEMALANLRDQRGTPEDLKQVRVDRAALHATSLAQLGPNHPATREVEIALAMDMFTDGDVAGAKVKLDALRTELPWEKTRRMRVKVVDAAGKPVEGATVTAGPSIWGAGSVAAYPDAGLMNYQRSGATSASGELTFEVPRDGLVIAQKGELRSRGAIITDALTLELAPTSRLEGKVDLRGEPASKVTLAINDLRDPPTNRYELIAPVRPDGSFVIEGVPRTKVKLYAAINRGASRAVQTKEIVVAAPVIEDLAIEIPSSGRAVHVIVRSTVSIAVGGAQVFIQPGVQTSTTLDKFKVDNLAAIKFAKVPDERTPAIAKAQLRPGDVVATLSAPPTGPVTACALGVPGEIDDPELDRKIRDNLGKLEIRCTPVPATGQTVVLEVPPWPRLD